MDDSFDSIKNEYITIVSHGLRMLLMQSHDYIYLLESMNDEKARDTEQLSNLLTKFRQLLESMELSLGEMINVSQLGHNCLNLNIEETTLESILRSTIELFSDSIQHHKLSLVARGFRFLPFVHVDIRFLTQAIQNIIGNAIRYSPENERIDLTAEVKKNEDGISLNEVIITVQDKGVGIAPENHKRIFNQYTHPTESDITRHAAKHFNKPGAGLGLTIASAVISAHGGNIWVESTGYDPKKMPGTKIYLVLPLIPPKNATRRIRLFGS